MPIYVLARTPCDSPAASKGRIAVAKKCPFSSLRSRSPRRLLRSRLTDGRAQDQKDRGEKPRTGRGV
ncbi:unnamed protein product [Amoebophrya sp. A120]|nr:unnamed protein product [Amoebophrya sp. A120]|eukprot:GSA120T00006812001.1